MSDESSHFQLAFPPNPNFGTGRTRRRIELVNNGSRTSARLADPFHEMECQVDHDGQHVTAVSGVMHRYPTTLCPGATALTGGLTGASIHRPTEQFYAPGVLPRHCTHLFDLACLAIAHAGRTEPQRVYEAIVPDERDGPVLVEVRRDGRSIHAWTVRRGFVISPGEVAGLPLLRGFLAKGGGLLSGDALEAALVLARTYLVSLGRPYDTEAWAGRPTSLNAPLRDRCYAYATYHSDAGRFMSGYIRDFDGGPRDPD